MRSTVFFVVFGLFPVLISGFPFLVQRDGNDTSISTSNSTSAPINGEPVNSTSSTAPTGTNTTDSSSNSTSTSTSSAAPTSASTNTTVSSSNNSTSTAASSDVATNLMALNLLIAKSFYEQAIAISQGLNDSNASSILGAGAMVNSKQLNSLNSTAGDLNCTFALGSVLNQSNTTLLISSMTYLESIKHMGTAYLLSNASFDLSQTEQDLFMGIYQNTLQVSVLAGNISDPGVPLNNHPNITQEDYNSLLFKFNPTCLSDLGLQNFPNHPAEGFNTPYTLPTGFHVQSNNQGCPDLSAVFCQVIAAGLNGTQALVSPQTRFCSVHATSGPALFYTTRTADPMSIDLTERQTQGGNICSGPDLLLLHN